MITIELALFTFALLAIWWGRRRQLRSLEQQRLLLRRFSDGVAAWRAKPGIPADARQAIEMLVDMPLDRKVVRRFAIAVLSNKNRPNLDQNSFWLVRNELDDEQQEAFDWLLVTFFMAFTYGDWITGEIIRRGRFSGLSRKPQQNFIVAQFR